MDQAQIKNSGILIISNLIVNIVTFLRQILMAWLLGVSAGVDLLLLAMIVPAIIQAMIGGGAGEIMVIKREKAGFREGSFEALFIASCIIPVIILGALYYLCLNPLIPLFKIGNSDPELFRSLSLIFILNMVPGTFTSMLRPHLYSRGLYGFYAVSTVVSQLAGILYILVAAKSQGIYAFAWSLLFANALNAIWFSFRSGLAVKDLFSLEVWRHEMEQLIILIRRVVSLSAQTFLNRFAVFWERYLSVRYLEAGYLSALNYSKTLTELPNTVLLSSVLTTSYLEQVKFHKEDKLRFNKYTADTLDLLLRAGFLFQVIMLVLAPALIIVVFRRGKFDNEAVQTSLVIFNILTVGFLPRMIMNYLSRTMYIIGEYRALLFAVFIKFVVQVALMVSLISFSRHIIPVSIVISFLLISVQLFIYVARKGNLMPVSRFIVRLIVITVVSAACLFLHSKTLDFYLGWSNLKILLLFTPAIAGSTAAVLIFLKRNDLEPGIIKRLKSLL